MDKNLDPRMLTPINGTILMVDDKKEEVSHGGIVLPSTAEADRMLSGTILARSPFLLEDGRWMDPPIEVGEKAVYGMHAGAASVWTDEKDQRVYRLVKWNEVLARYTDAQPSK